MLRQVNQYSTEIILATSAPDQGPGVAFGFEATRVRIWNDAGVPIHFSFASTAVATTGDPEIKAGGIIEMTVPPITGLGLATTSTTTSTSAADGHRVLVSAWGG